MKSFVVFEVLALAIVADAGVSMNNPFFCYTTDPIRSMTNRLATITSYEAIRRFNFTTTNPYISSEQDFRKRLCRIFNNLPLACTPARFWYLGRYGGRFPHRGPIDRMIEFGESSVSL